MIDGTIRIRLAKTDDNEAINTSFNRHFLRDEPMNLYLKDYKSSDDSSPDSVPDHGFTLVAEAVDHQATRIEFVGFLMCEPCNRPRTKDEDSIVIRKDNRAGYEIFRILSELDRRFDMFTLYKLQQALDMVILSVVPEYRGQSIGLKLCKEAIRMATLKGIDLVFMDCTSSFSAAIATKLGMECIGEIAYADFQDECGEKLFDVCQPHTHIRRFIKLLKKI